MNKKQSALFADKAIDFGHVIFGALVVGQFVSQEPVKWALLASGLAVLLLCYWVSVSLLED